MNIHTPFAPASERLGWRLTYAEAPVSGHRFADQVQPSAVGWPGQPVLTATSIEDLFAQSADSRRQSLDVIWGGAPSSSANELEHQLEEWIAKGLGTGEKLIRASIRTIRIVWSPRRTYFLCSAEAVDDVLDALGRFSVLAWKANALEQEMRSVWPVLDAQRHLVQATTKFRQRYRKSLFSLTERVSRMQSEILKVSPVVHQLNVPATILSKRLFSELADQAELEGRLDVIEEPINHAYAQCELLNDRVIESRSASSIRTLELTIISLLLLELVIWGLSVTWETGLFPQVYSIFSAVKTIFG